MKPCSFSHISLWVFVGFYLASLAFPSVVQAYSADDELAAQNNNSVKASAEPENILNNKVPLPINARILSLLSLVQQNDQKNTVQVTGVLLQLEEINSTFNAAEQYLIFLIHGLIEHHAQQDKQAIAWLEKTLNLRDEIPEKQLYLPEFSEVNLIFARSFSALGDFKQAFDYKKKYIRNGYQYFEGTRADKVKELNITYATDQKIKQNELLANQNKIKRLKIIAAENKKFAQQRNILILVITVIVFFILLLRQIKVRKKLKYLAKVDSLTNLYNRRTLFEKGAESVDIAVNEKQSLSVILLDIDFFKNINDNYGHDIGDEVIIIIAELGSETMRSRDLFARLGGEEFAGILPGVGCAEAKAIAERLREKVASKDWSEFNIKEQLTVCIGVACLEQVEPNFDALLNAADIAMYYAKANGRNRVYQFNDESQNYND
ncbi:GGDEF domain-containing protein [Colwellia hornerae]|uniref:diguanylate cyclase n=1 Tax=Colwellia hornerae TaxID=89402 RepID=A0A5C6QSX2_9GAMM|nr:GGDEF domain-containing protein [Colwellia hornerae]TWX56953.1 GGDEF domain-containing protein [Colwellia hornerae]TWX62322.1 GGDEF domain-containing protein [Colwellia hornerae]TWX72346.1 GGDEF domain-containing protein [Colwellia hornerae]